MYHPLKKKRGKQFKTRPLQRNSSHMENGSSRGAAASPAAMERPIRAGKSSQRSAQVGGSLLFWGKAQSSQCSAWCEGLQVPPAGKGLLKTGKIFLKDAFPIFSGHPKAGLCTHGTIAASSSASSTPSLASWQHHHHDAPSLSLQWEDPQTPQFPPLFTSQGPPSALFPRDFLPFEFLFAACCNKYPETGF